MLYTKQSLVYLFFVLIDLFLFIEHIHTFPFDVIMLHMCIHTLHVCDGVFGCIGENLV